MLNFGNVFVCCGNQVNQKEISVSTDKKKRSHTCQTTSRKTFIKRSVGKNPVLDLSEYISNNSAFLKPKVQNTEKIQIFGDRKQPLNINNKPLLIQYPLKQKNNQESQKHKIERQSFISRKIGQRDINRFINYSDLSPTKTKLAQSIQPPPAFNKPIDLVYNYKTPPQRLQFNHTIKEGRTQCGIMIKYLSNQKTPSSNNAKSNQKPTILQTIQQKSSMKSYCQSHHYVNTRKYSTPKTIVHYNHQTGEQSFQTIPNITIQQSQVFQPFTQQLSTLKSNNHNILSKNKRYISLLSKPLIINRTQTEIDPFSNQVNNMHNLIQLKQSQHLLGKQKLVQQFRMFEKNKNEMNDNKDLKDKQLKKTKTIFFNQYYLAKIE